MNDKVLSQENENGGRIILEFVGLKSKMYATFLFSCGKTSFSVECPQHINEVDDDAQLDIDVAMNYMGVINKKKGITVHSLRKIKYEDYINCLFEYTNMNIV